MAHQLRNELVAIELEHEEARAAIEEAHPELADSTKALAESNELVEAVRQTIKSNRVKQRSNKLVSKEDKDSLSVALKAHKLVKDAHREILKRVRPLMREDYAGARGVARDACKAARKKWVDQGLYWATGNAVLDDFYQSVDRIIKARTRGEPAQLRFHSWSGEGTINVQVQRKAGMPVRSGELLASGEGPYRNAIQLKPWVDPELWETKPLGVRRKEARGELRFMIGSKFEQKTLPVVVHRMMPRDADVADLQITRRRGRATRERMTHWARYLIK